MNPFKSDSLNDACIWVHPCPTYTGAPEDQQGNWNPYQKTRTQKRDGCEIPTSSPNHHPPKPPQKECI